MSLIIKEIKLENFRNHESFLLSEPGRQLIIMGNNAVGKTNIIEAIQLLSTQDSFRDHQWNNHVRMGCESARLSMLVEKDGIETETILLISDGKRRFSQNGKKKNINELKNPAPAVVFTPENLELIKGSPSCRRDEIDSLAGQISLTYRKIADDYRKLITQRNNLLKDETIDTDLVMVWEEAIADVGAQYYQHRLRLINRLSPQISKAYENIAAGETLGVFYDFYLNKYLEEQLDKDTVCSIDKAELKNVLLGAFDNAREEEIARRTTLIGPHKDDIVFTIDDKNARLFGSQGQQRSLVLAVKIAEIAVLRDLLGCEPILLLDDVMSELDEHRREALMDAVGENSYMFITTTNINYFSEAFLAQSQIVRLPIGV